jgi:hypothetical protein
LNPGGDQRHRLDQALDMGILARIAGKLQLAGDLRIAPGKFAA